MPSNTNIGITVLETINTPADTAAPAPAPVAASAPADKELTENRVEDEENGEEEVAHKSSADPREITYTIYGEKYTDNQANMMLNVCKKVLEKHPDAVAKILDDPEKPLIRCASATNYEIPENKKGDIPTRYNQGAFFDVGGGIFIGTALNYAEKLRNISRLFAICGEDLSVFHSEQVELSKAKFAKEKASSSGDETYSIYGEEHTGNQAQMMINAMKYLIEKHFDKREELAQLTSVKLSPISELNMSFFKVGGEFAYQGVTYSIGTSYGRKDKLAQIRKAIEICGEDISQFRIEGLNDTNASAAQKQPS